MSAQDSDYIVLSGVPLLASANGGKSFKSIGGDNVHSDHHHVWINPRDPQHMINGNDGGINITYDGGAHWMKNNTPTVGQFYYINTDNESPLQRLWRPAGQRGLEGCAQRATQYPLACQWSKPLGIYYGRRRYAGANRHQKFKHCLHRFSVWKLLQIGPQ